MRLLCLFDLPTETHDNKKDYRLFRKHLIKNGFVMIQYSVYMRVCVNRTFANKYIPKLKQIAPRDGNVRLILVTEKQYEDMILIQGNKSHQELTVHQERIVVI